MNDQEWVLALGEESERVERKESRTGDDDLQAACALANDLGNSRQAGYLTLGVSKDGRFIGVDSSDQALQSISSRMRSTKIYPNPSVSVDTRQMDGVGIVVVRVEPYPVPPIVRVGGTTWVRVGSTTRRATDVDIARLNERRPENRRPFDLRPVPTATIEDLNLGLLKDWYYADKAANFDPETYPNLQEWLLQHDIVTLVGSAAVPTAAGILVFGTEPTRLIPGSFVEFVRYAGTDFDAPVTARKTISGSLPDQLEGLWAQLQAHITDAPAGEEGIRSPYSAEYPMEALKELARNLVQHRLYEGTNAPGRVSWLDDCVVFNNPGGPFGLAGEGEFGDHSDYRNPTITGLLLELGYVERLGRGVRRVRSLLAKGGHPHMLQEFDGFTTLIVRRR